MEPHEWQEKCKKVKKQLDNNGWHCPRCGKEIIGPKHPKYDFLWKQSNPRPGFFKCLKCNWADNIY